MTVQRRARPARRRAWSSSPRWRHAQHRHGHDRAERGPRNGLADISFTVPFATTCLQTLKAVEEAVKQVGRRTASRCDDDVSKISVVGLGMATQSGAWPRPCSAPWPQREHQHRDDQHQRDQDLGGREAREFAQEALRTIHEAFQLSKTAPAQGGATVAADGVAPRVTTGNGEAMMARLSDPWKS